VDNRLLHRILARISTAALIRGGTDLNRKQSWPQRTSAHEPRTWGSATRLGVIAPT
jgi:hypothetical protein